MTWPAIAADAVPAPLRTDAFALAPLGPEHNDADHDAWMSSIDHIHATPGFGDGTWGSDAWPYAMPADDNLADLVMHRGEFDRGEAYVYTVLDLDGHVIGCVYVDPDDGGLADAKVRSWVRVSHAHLDQVVHRDVDAWLRRDWPFGSVRWPGRQPVTG